jgi:chromosome partitioning protein
VTAALALEPLRAPVLLRRHVCVIGNQKGGAGKSTVAMHMVVALLRMGRRVGVIDLDVRQRTLTRYIENRARSAAGRASPMPQIVDVRESTARHLDDAEREQHASLRAALLRLDETCDYIVADAPGGDSLLSRLAHAHADTLVTPLNDSFVDFDLLGDVDAERPDIVHPSIYSEMVWDCRKRKAYESGKPIDWIVMRNRTSASRIEAKNKQRVGEALKTLSTRIGFRIAPGRSERVIFRELFPQGLTLLDLDSENADGELRMSHLAARQEVRDLFIALKLPGLDAEPLRF